MTRPILELRDLDVRYGGVRAVTDVSISVPQGGFVALLGPNGAGKSTIARAITGLLAFHGGSVSSGTVALNGESIVGLRPDQVITQGVGYVPEGRQILPGATVEENLLLGASSSRPSRDILRSNLQGIYERFPPLAERKMSHAKWLSGGEQQMLAIGRALIHDPQLLICDELSLGLAPTLVKELIESLANACRSLGTAVLLIEQNARLALRFCDYAHVIESGRILLSGDSKELQASPDLIERYLGYTTTGPRDGSPS